MSNVKSLLKGSIILLVANIFLKAMNFFLLPLYTSYLTPEDYGMVDLVFTASSLLIALLCMCLDSGFFTYFYDENSDEYKKKVFNTTFFATVLIAIVPLLAIIFANKLSYLIYKENHSEIIILAAIYVSATLMTLIPAAQIKIDNKMKIFGIINVTVGFCSIGLNVLMVVYLKVGYLSLVITNALVGITQLITFLMLTKKSVSIKHFDIKLLKKILLYTLPLIPATISTWILDFSDRYFILNYYSEAEVGLYGVANKIVILITVFLTAFQTSYTSFVFSNAQDEDAKDNFRKVLNYFMIIFLGIGAFVSIFSKEIIMVMTDSAFLQAYKMIPFLIFGQIAFGIAFLVGAGMSIAKKSKYSMLVSWISALVNITLNIILIPRIGAIAASITTWISFFIVCILNYYFSQRFYRCNYQFLKAITIYLLVFIISLLTFEFSFLIKILIYIALGTGILLVYKNDVSLLLDGFMKKIKNKK